MAGFREPADIEAALEGDRQGMTRLVERLLPAVQAEVGWALLRDARSECRDARQDLRDFVQEVFVALLAERGKALRRWNPERGRSLDSYVRLIARRRVVALLRASRLDEPMAGDAIDLHTRDESELARQLESSDVLEHMLARLDARLDERGALLFRLLYVEERSVEEVMDTTAMTRDAIYAWRLRFRKLASSLQPGATRVRQQPHPQLGPPRTCPATPR